MFRIGIMLFVLLLIGTQLLSFLGSEDVSSFILFIVLILLGIAGLKLGLDAILHKQKSAEDKDLDERSGVRSYDDISAYTKAAKRRHAKRFENE